MYFLLDDSWSIPILGRRVGFDSAGVGKTTTRLDPGERWSMGALESGGMGAQLTCVLIDM